MNLACLTQINLSYLNAVGVSLLLFSFGFRIVLALRKQEKLEPCFVGLAIGLLGITFFSTFIDILSRLSDALTQEIQRLGDAQALKKLVLQSIEAAANEPDANGNKVLLNIPAVIEQLFRFGVWGTASSIADFFFLIAQTFVEVRRDVLLGLVRFLMPLIWGLYPLRPEFGHSICSYLLEMALWGPCLYLIQILISHIAPGYVYRPGSLGIPIVALEIVATILILDVPKMVHQLLGGVLHPQGESTALGLIFLGSRTATKAGVSAAALKSKGSKKEKD
ncbi:MAG: hypothetical protein HYX41_07005 [Bdellovibrio sp.]|nr:hypothetical protein [Bdellovibrio sp.]